MKQDIDVAPGIRIRVSQTTCPLHRRCVCFGVLEQRVPPIDGHEWIKTNLSWHFDASVVPIIVEALTRAAAS